MNGEKGKEALSTKQRGGKAARNFQHATAAAFACLPRRKRNGNKPGSLTIQQTL